MTEYHKIHTVFNRNPDTKFRTVIEGNYSKPEFDYLKYNLWTFTEKVDGTNIRIIIDNHSVSYRGKTDNAQIHTKLYARLQEIFNTQTDKLFEMFPHGACLYGEGYGAQIQKSGGNYCPTQDFVLFDVNIRSLWLERSNIEDIANKLSLRVVPVIGEGTFAEMVEHTRVGFKSVWGDFYAEGIVARPKRELLTREGARIITKIKTRDFAIIL